MVSEHSFSLYIERIDVAAVKFFQMLLTEKPALFFRDNIPYIFVYGTLWKNKWTRCCVVWYYKLSRCVMRQKRSSDISRSKLKRKQKCEIEWLWNNNRQIRGLLTISSLHRDDYSITNNEFRPFFAELARFQKYLSDVCHSHYSQTKVETNQ